MILMTKLLSIMNRRVLTLINITVRGSELRPTKATTNYGYAFVGNSQILRWTSSDKGLFRKDTTQFLPPLPILSMSGTSFRPSGIKRREKDSWIPIWSHIFKIEQKWRYFLPNHQSSHTTFSRFLLTPRFHPTGGVFQTILYRRCLGRIQSRV